MKIFKDLWILKIFLLIFALLWEPLTSMALASDPKLTAKAKLRESTVEEKQRAFVMLKQPRTFFKRSCKVGNLSIVAGPHEKPESKYAAIKFPKKVRCPNDDSKVCSEWRYRFSWKGSGKNLNSVHLNIQSQLKLLGDVSSEDGATVCSVKTLDNRNPHSSRKIPGPKFSGKFSFDSRQIDCEVDPSANRIEVSFITPRTNPGIVWAGGSVSSGSPSFCQIDGPAVRNVKPLGSSANIQCFPPIKGDIVGAEIRRGPDNNLDINTGLHFFIGKGTKVSFPGCDGNTAIKPLIVKSGFTTCGSSKGGSSCLIKNPKKPKGPQTFSITEGKDGEAGLICVDLKNAKPAGCDITGMDPSHLCSTFYCNTGGCDGTAYACNPKP